MKIYLETTSTTNNELNTGIQRVVRNIAKNSMESSRAFDLDVEMINYNSFALHRVDFRRMSEPATPKATTFRPSAALRFGYRRLLQLIALVMPVKKARQFVRAPANRIGLTWLLLLPFRKLRQWYNPLPAKNSAIVLIDSSWTYPEILGRVDEFKRNGGVVIGVVYDTIPISHPQFYSPALTSEFKEWLARLLSVADGVVCISAFSARCLKEVVDERIQAGLLENRPLITHFHLGAELDLAEAGATAGPRMQQIFQKNEHIFLVVGSIEPRKNHAYILDAFDRFWAAHGAATLLIIGKHGWKSDDLLERFAAHPKHGKQLQIVRDASDTDLEFAYMNASALVFASQIEGFGLPIVEAFQRGLPVLCSDIPVFREIADGKAMFFELSSPEHLKASVEKFCQSHDVSRRTARSPQPYMSWKQSTHEFYQRVSEICEQARRQNLAATELTSAGSSTPARHDRLAAPPVGRAHRTRPTQQRPAL